MKIIEKDESVSMMSIKNGEVVHWEGIAPVIHENLKWVYLNKVGDKWVPIENEEEAKIQLVGYGEALTEEQIEKLMESYKE
ncbi:hypothetical protein GF312_01125 [Candidatus Poribacteria bacterium]|nr:hypothetical protein [Candidatus Poribacteria bacterium]